MGIPSLSCSLLHPYQQTILSKRTTLRAVAFCWHELTVAT
jgi:hypothetical protein